jgi:enoyl-CoA hydratase/carnithine racemase
VELFSLIEGLGKPLVGRINGHALAGGFGLACACDLLYAADGANFGTPEINVGVWPMMIQAILARNLPRKIVLEMMMLGGRWTAEQMRDIGLVNRVVPYEMLDTTIKDVTSKLVAMSPAVMRLGRDAFYRSQDMEYRAALEYLHTQLGLVTRTEDAREGVTAFFEKRQPNFTGK